MLAEGLPLSLGKLAGVIYDFPSVGDILPMHEHDEANNHITIVARGSFLARGSLGWEKTVKAGDVLDWDAHDPHEFVALEPASRIVNIRK